MEIERTRRLLQDVFPHDEKFGAVDFLQWEYLEGPSGEVVCAERGDEAGLLGHYAVLPQRWVRHGAPELWALSLNTAVSERARGQGLFTTLAEETYRTAAARGVKAVVGVANAQSTPGFLGRLGFENLGPLDVVVTPPRPSRLARAFDRIDTAAALHDPLVAAAGQPSQACCRQWLPDELSWRLRAPGSAFAIFRGPGAMVVTCVTAVRGIRVAIVVKVFCAPDVEPLPLASAVWAACRHHRAPLALYAGINPGVAARGVPLPDRLRPSPLNLIVRSLTDEEPSSGFRPAVFEFLDFDAY